MFGVLADIMLLSKYYKKKRLVKDSNSAISFLHFYSLFLSGEREQSSYSTEFFSLKKH